MPVPRRRDVGKVHVVALHELLIFAFGAGIHGGRFAARAFHRGLRFQGMILDQVAHSRDLQFLDAQEIPQHAAAPAATADQRHVDRFFRLEGHACHRAVLSRRGSGGSSLVQADQGRARACHCSP